VFERCRLPAPGRIAGGGANLLSLMKDLDHFFS
jgi:hypothetical protein